MVHEIYDIYYTEYIEYTIYKYTEYLKPIFMLFIHNVISTTGYSHVFHHARIELFNNNNLAKNNNIFIFKQY